MADTTLKEKSKRQWWQPPTAKSETRVLPRNERPPSENSSNKVVATPETQSKTADIEPKVKPTRDEKDESLHQTPEARNNKVEESFLTMIPKTRCSNTNLDRPDPLRRTQTGRTYGHQPPTTLTQTRVRQSSEYSFTTDSSVTSPGGSSSTTSSDVLPQIDSNSGYASLGSHSSDTALPISEEQYPDYLPTVISRDIFDDIIPQMPSYNTYTPQMPVDPQLPDPYMNFPPINMNGYAGYNEYTGANSLPHSDVSPPPPYYASQYYPTTSNGPPPNPPNPRGSRSPSALQENAQQNANPDNTAPGPCSESTKNRLKGILYRRNRSEYDILRVWENGNEANLSNGDTFLIQAVRERNMEKISHCIDYLKRNVKLTSINQKNSTEETPLSIACYHGEKDVIRLLISYGADPRVSLSMGNTCLHLAADKDEPGRRTIFLVLDAIRGCDTLRKDFMEIVEARNIFGATFEEILRIKARRMEMESSRQSIEVVLKTIEKYKMEEKEFARRASPDP